MHLRCDSYGKAFATAVWIAAVFCVLPMNTAQAQTSGKLRLLVDPGDSYEFVVDHQFRMQQREVELTTGPHHFSFWAPKRMVVDTTLVVEEGRTKSVVLYLPYSKDYLVYQRELQQYQRTCGVPYRRDGGAAFTIVSYSKAKKKTTIGGPRGCDENRSPTWFSVPEVRNDPAERMTSANTQYLVATGVTALFTGAAY